MSIETHLNQSGRPDRIHDLTIEAEKRSRLRLDVKQSMRPENWEIFRALFDGFRTREGWYDFAQLAASMRLLDAPRDFGITEDDWNALLEEEKAVDLDLAKQVSFISYLFLIDSAKVPAIRVRRLVDKAHLNMTAMKSYDLSSYAQLSSSLRIIDPFREPEITDHDWGLIRRKLGSARSHRTPYSFLEDAVSLRLLKHSRDLELTEDDWIVLNEEFKKVQFSRFSDSLGNPVDFFGNYAALLRLLAAHDVRITAPGKISITDRTPDLHTQTPPRPERKAT